MLEYRETKTDLLSDAPKRAERMKLAELSFGRIGDRNNACRKLDNRDELANAMRSVICQTSNTRPVRDQNATKSRPANGRDWVAQKAPLTGDFIHDSSASHRFASTGDPSLPTKKIGDRGVSSLGGRTQRKI